MELKCKFYDAAWRDGKKYTCVVEEASITKSGSEMVSFTGVHKNGKTDEDVEVLYFYDSVVEFIPRGIAKHFSRLTNLTIQNCGLKEVKRADLDGFLNLEFFYLAYNKLTTQPNDLIVVENTDFQLINFQGNSKNDEFFEKNKRNTVESLLTTIDQNCTPPIENYTFDKPVDGWGRKQEELFKTGKLSDFTIKFREKEYKVHKIILAAQSPVFDKLFGESSKSEQNLNDMKNFTENAFEDFLRYFYTGTVKSKNNAMELLELAAEFAVPELIQICEQMIFGILSESNLLEVYSIGHAHSLILKQTAFERIKRLFPELKDRSIDNVELVHKLMNAKRLLDEARKAADKSDQ